MRDLYQRLSGIGFDAKFVRAVILPDWWDDSLASEPANRAIAELAIARHLGLKTASLRNPAEPLSLPSLADFRLKCSKNTPAEDVWPSVIVSQRAARLVVELVEGMPPFSAPSSALALREQILERQPYVALKSLADLCWQSGIVVIHIAPERLPKARRFHGIALFCGQTPVIVLGSGRDSRPWLAFHLAHELGHLCLKHVSVAGRPVVDSNIDRIDDDSEEMASNEFATELLTGEKQLALKRERGMTGSRLADAASRYGLAHKIDPGTVALIYARSVGKWPIAQVALRYLGQRSGAKKTLADALLQHRRVKDIPESSARFLGVLSAEFA